ncbi:MAG: zeta toxin family protein [Rickettsiales bacterium]|jgi:hypothetical protein|nr:zeta toxin family protein [Rickettsiales bacterium]
MFLIDFANNMEKYTEFINKIWKEDHSDIDYEFVIEKAFTDITKGHTKSTDKLIIKLGGQSGSGKTTQLLPSIRHGLEKNNIDYVHLAVRLFAEYHPYYGELLDKFGKQNIREKTNGFALTILIGVLKKLVGEGYNIFYEVTLLDPVYEERVIMLLKENNYNIIFSILAVPLSLSNLWIEERKQKMNEESNRIVKKSSSNYFYDILPLALKSIVKNKEILNEGDHIIIWDVYSNTPILNTNVFDGNLLSVYDKNIKISTKKADYTEDELRMAKIIFYDNFFRNFYSSKSIKHF